MRMSITVNQMKTWLSCGLRYRFIYVDRSSKPMLFGERVLRSALHAVILRIHEFRLADKMLTPAGAIDAFEVEWRKRTALTKVEWSNAEYEDQLMHWGRRVVAFLAKHLLPLQTLKAVQAPFERPLTDAESGESLPVYLRGVFDLVEENDEIARLQTHGSPLHQIDADANLRLTAFSYAYQRLFDREPSLRLMTLNDELIELRALRTLRIERDYQKLFRLAKEVISGVSSGIFTPNPGKQCSRCEYKTHCWMWDGKVQPEN